MPFPVYALALAAFAIGTAEFIPNGLLPQTAQNLGVSVAAAGWLTTGYAIGVVIGGPLIAAATMRLARHRVLTILTVVFAFANIASALAPTLELVVAGRLVAGAAHGGFIGLASVVAAALVPAEKQGRAIAVVFTGFAASTVAGVPLGTLIGQHTSWRGGFWLIAALATLGLVAVLTTVRAGHIPATSSLRDEITVFRQGRVWAALCATAIGYGGLFASYTYIAPLLTEEAGFPESAIVWLLLLFGVGLLAGNQAGGRLADRALIPTITVFLMMLAAALAVLAITAGNQPVVMILLVVLGAVGFGLVPPLQTFVIRLAGASSTMLSTANISAFNIGIAAGSLLGGTVIDLGLGYRAPSLAGAIMTAIGLGLFALVARTTRPATPDQPAPGSTRTT